MIRSKKMEDYAVMFMIVMVLAFHDRTEVMIGSQVIAFLCVMRSVRFRFLHKQCLPYVIWQLMYIGLCALSSLWAISSRSIFRLTISQFQILLCGFTMIQYIFHSKKLELVLNTICASGMILIARLLIVVPRNAWGTAERVGGYLGAGRDGGYGGTGLTYVLSLCSAFALYLAVKKKSKSHWAIFLLTTLFSMLSGSKKAFFLAAIILLVMLLSVSNNPNKIIKSLFGGAILVVLIWTLLMNVPVLYNSIGNRIELMLSFFLGGESDNSTVGRVRLIDQAVMMIKTRPFLGYGLDNFRVLNNRNCWAENNVLEVFADLGFVGLVVYYWFPFSILLKVLQRRNLFRVKLHEKGLILAFLASLLFIDLSMVTYSGDDIQMYLAIIYSVCMLLCWESEERQFVNV